MYKKQSRASAIDVNLMRTACLPLMPFWEITSAFTAVPTASSARATGALGTVTAGGDGAGGRGKGVGGGGRIVDIDYFSRPSTTAHTSTAASVFGKRTRIGA